MTRRQRGEGSVFKRLLCQVRLHAWAYSGDPGAYRQFRTCAACSLKQSRRNPWYVPE